jgi:hypothetical protein
MESAPARPRWGMSGGASLAAHGAVLIACLTASVRRDQPPVTIELHAVEAAAAPASEPPGSGAPAAHPMARAHRAQRRRVTVTAPTLAPVSMDSGALAVPTPRDPDETEGDDGPAFGSGKGGAGVAGPGGGGGPPVPARPEAPPITPLEAAYLRTYQTYPNLPRSLWVHGKVYTVIVEMCITADGRVREVTLKQGAAPALDGLVVSTLRTWRYRARLVNGQPRAFCHPMIIHYDVD